MPRSFLMSPDFDGRHARWRKTYKGKPYTVTCTELGLPEAAWTEVGSYQAANEWWKKRRAEIDNPIESWVQQELAELVEREAEKDKKIEDALKQRRQLLNRVNPVRFPVGPPPPPPAVTVGQALDQWYALLEVNAMPTTLVRLSLFVRDCKALGSPAVLSADQPVTVIDEGLVEKVFHHVDAVKRKPASKVRYFGMFKSFVGYCVEIGLIPLPKNLRSKRLTWPVTITTKTIPDWDVVREFLNGLPDRLRLYALLAMNTGMNNTDIAHLTERQIDFKRATLRRKRVKTAGWDRVPTVLYRLWSETARLLKQEMTPGGEFALFDRFGKPLYVTSKMDGGKVYDKIKSQWRDTLGRSSDRPFTLKDFRDFGSLLLQNSKYRSYRVSWLGQTPKEVHETNYSGEEDVTEACKWMESVIFARPDKKSKEAKATRASGRRRRSTK